MFNPLQTLNTCCCKTPECPPDVWVFECSRSVSFSFINWTLHASLMRVRAEPKLQLTLFLLKETEPQWSNKSSLQGNYIYQSSTNYSHNSSENKTPISRCLWSKCVILFKSLQSLLLCFLNLLLSDNVSNSRAVMMWKTFTALNGKYICRICLNFRYFWSLETHLWTHRCVRNTWNPRICHN